MALPAVGTLRVVCRRGPDASAPTAQLFADAVGWSAENVVLVRGCRGKPYVGIPASDVSFSVARTRGVGLVALTRGVEVGVDVECIDRDVTEWALWRHALTERERSFLPAELRARNAALLLRWAAKEAILKASGLGLAVDPASIELGRDGTVVTLPPALGHPEDWAVLPIPISGCAAAVAFRTRRTIDRNGRDARLRRRVADADADPIRPYATLPISGAESELAKITLRIDGGRVPGASTSTHSNSWTFRLVSITGRSRPLLP